jgi:protein-tyrosine phosphatase
MPRRFLLHKSAAVAVLLLLLSNNTYAQVDVPDYAGLHRFHKVSERLFRGGQPRSGGLRRLAELEINTVVNLRGENQRTRADEAEARSLGLDYFNVPLPRWGLPDDATMRRVLEIIAAPDSGLVFIHCRDGVDRTGMVVALYRISHEGWTARDALFEADRRGMRKVQFWMRDYIEDYGHRIRERGAEAKAHHQSGDDDWGNRIGDGVRIVERKAFRARKDGARFLRRSLGAISGFLSGIF